MSLIARPPTRFTQRAQGAAFTIAGGALGWIDTDISAAVPAGAKMIACRCWASANQDCGARPPGAAYSTVFNNPGLVFEFILANVVAQHVEFYRAAANNAYYIQGYWT